MGGAEVVGTGRRGRRGRDSKGVREDKTPKKTGISLKLEKTPISRT